MAARRNRRGRRRNRGRFGFLYKLLSVLLIFAAILVGCMVFFRVDKIEVQGQSQYSQEEIIEVSGVKQGDNLFRLNKFQIAQRVLTRLPYVDNLSFTRRWPDTLVLTVSECVPVAVIEEDGAYWLLDTKCKVLERGDSSLATDRAQVLGLEPLAPTVGTVLTVEEAQRKKLQSLKALLKALEYEGMTGSVVSFIDLSADNELRFSYGEGLTVIMPMIADFDRQVYALKKTLWEMDASGVPRTGTLDFTINVGGRESVSLLPDRWMPGIEVEGQEEDAPQEMPTGQGTEEGAIDG